MKRWAILHAATYHFDDLDWGDGAGAQSDSWTSSRQHGTSAARAEAEAELRILRWMAPPFENWYVAEVDE